MWPAHYAHNPTELGLEPKLRSAKFTENTRNTNRTAPLSLWHRGVREREKKREREREGGISMCLVQIIVQAASTFLVVFIRIFVSFWT